MPAAISSDTGLAELFGVLALQSVKRILTQLVIDALFWLMMVNVVRWMIGVDDEQFS